MRILMQNRLDAFKNKGGDTVQMLRTKEYLEKLGVEVDISLELEPDLKKYDIVHLFNISRVDETWIQFKNAKKQNKKIAISTIYHSKSQIREYEKYGLDGISGKLIKLIKNENNIEVFKTLIRTIYSSGNFKPFLKQFKIGYDEQQKYIVKNADIILPNSEMELDFIINELGIERRKINNCIIPNGIELKEEYKKNDYKSLEEKYPYKDFIFCAGRIEPLKNQIKLIEALKETNYTLVFVGAINKKHRKYYKKFNYMISKNKNVHYLGMVDKEEMNYLYKAAKVTILPSWFETTGLTGIESLSQGTPAIVTNRGYTREYYSDFVIYCNPADCNSIRKSIELSNNIIVEKNIVNLIKQKFNWKIAAQRTLDAYKEITN